MGKMKTNKMQNGGKNTFGSACLGSCKQILAQIRNVKENLLAETRDTFQAHEQLVQLALNEAEPLAYQTLYPQLVFADLATEKIQQAANWSRRQRLLA